jgi:hypothetical protein
MAAEADGAQQRQGGAAAEALAAGVGLAVRAG